MKSKRTDKPVVHLTFYDHANTNPAEAQPYLCDVYGVLFKEDNLAYYVAAWVHDKNVKEHNNEIYTILKSCVTRKRILR